MRQRSQNTLAILISLCVVCSLMPATAFADDALSNSDDVTTISQLSTTDPSAAQVMQDYFDARADEVAGSEPADATPADVTSEVAQVSEAREDNLKDMADQANLEVKSADTDVTIDSVERNGSDLTIGAHEWTTFTYDDLSDGVGGEDVAAFGTDHELTISDGGDGAVITADSYDESDISGVDTTGEEPVVSTVSDTGLSASKVSSASMTATAQSISYDSNYDPRAAIAYADYHALDYNSAYRDFNPVGGDCANFTSQSISAGGMDQVKGTYSSSSAWWYSSSSSYSSSWVYCPAFISYFKTHGKYIENPTASQIYPGSPVVYMADGTTPSHATICVGYNSAGTPIIDAHNSDRYHVPYTYYNVARCTIQLTATNSWATTFYSGGAGGNTTYYEEFSSASASPFEWRETGSNTVVLDSYLGASATVTIPDTVTYDGTTCRVTGVNDSAFYKDTSLKTVVFGSNMQTIGDRAFYGCTALATVKGAASVTSIGSYGFAGCTHLSTLPSFPVCKVLYSCAFKNCDALTSLPTFIGIKRIKSGSFMDCDGLTTVNLKSAVLNYIGSSAFRACDELGSVTITSPKFKTIYTDGFSGDAKLRSVSISSAVFSTVKTRAFYKDKMLASVSFASSPVATIGESAFRACPSLAYFALRSTALTSIGANAFAGDIAMTKVVLKSTVLASIGTEAFMDCSALSTFTSFSARSLSIGSSAFWGCGRLTTFSASEAYLPSIADHVFFRCRYLGSLATKLTQVTSVGTGAFYGCTHLASLTIKSTALTSIGKKALYGCVRLATLKIYSSKIISTNIGDSAFTGVPDVARVYVPEAKVTKYRTWFRAKGLSTKATVTKL